MQMKVFSSDLIDLRSIDEPQLAEVHRRQNNDPLMHLSYMFDFELPWAPRTLSQVKAKIEEMQKEDRTALFAIFTKSNEFVGLGYYNASWNAWEPGVSTIIWPEHRGKGYGSEAARLLLEAAFDLDIARSVSCWIASWDERAIAFAESLGFKRAGVMRRAGVIGGKFYDVTVFDMLKEEYLAHRKKGRGK